MAALDVVGRFADVPFHVEVELDRRVLTIREILGLEVGSVIKMGRSAGENLDVLVGGVVACYGEIVVTETSTGVRITDFRREE